MLMNTNQFTKDELRVERSIERLISSCISKMSKLCVAHQRHEVEFQNYCEQHNLIYFP